ncbi:unnamed protein product [Medioppia subpectinata]|uniref:deoxyribose-phosphate aldolase n=1 Tax=Medioppia subpectinata TaxID=1979941 RepID=A0A7R9KSD4_9ACAR|nr:unnamed protein product [Medioppia subpectinata]CAG2107732.1 unnamed protein product [Medioppia subpectinata]
MSSDMFRFDNKVFENININTYNVKVMSNGLTQRFHQLDTESTIKELLFAIRSIDLTTLSGDDTDANVQRLCCRALQPLRSHLMDYLKANHTLSPEEPLTTAAVCVYPSRAADCVQAFERLATNSSASNAVSIACVATGFPSGQYSLETRLAEIEFAVKCGAHEIDVVVDRSLALNGLWNQMSDELIQMKDLCDRSGAHLKVIISAGELGSLDNVYKASMTAMLSGAHFIKTSTGKETLNATLPIGVVMTRAIGDYYRMTGRRVGFKVAGGLKTGQDAIDWIGLVKSQLGDQWLNRDLFRIGASSLLNDIENCLFRLVYKREPKHYELSL